MEPPFVKLRLPATPPAWLPGQDSEGACDDVPPGACVRKPLGSLDVVSCPVGPEGSGRYWTVTIGLASKQDPKPSRGVCFVTSTIAWRMRGETGRAALSPLRWLDDLDADGTAEGIVWDSFPLRDDAEQYESGLAAWVYRVDPQGSLALDWGLSRQIARQIASAYRSSPPGDPTGALRKRALDALEAFAERRCTTRAEGAHPSQ